MKPEIQKVSTIQVAQPLLTMLYARHPKATFSRPYRSLARVKADDRYSNAPPAILTRRTWLALLPLVFVATVITGCGQKGPLYLPSDEDDDEKIRLQPLASGSMPDLVNASRKCTPAFSRTCR